MTDIDKQMDNNINYSDLQKKIIELKKSKNAIILAHYYQDAQIQDIADFIGDSLELSRKAAQNDADIIMFCGVTFMADVAKILSPSKKVLVPDMNAGCSLEDSCKADEFEEFISKYKDHKVLTYINSSIKVKALSDIIVTSSSAETIINKLPKDQKIIFGPDRFLGKYVAKQTGRDMVLWHGSCIVHERFSEKELVKLANIHENAKIIAHPECPENLLQYADFIGSTSALLKYTTDSKLDEFIVLTEPGIIHQMELKTKNKKFYQVPGIDQGSCISCNNCPYMRLNNLDKIYDALLNEAPEIILDEDIRIKAKKALDNMLELSK